MGVAAAFATTKRFNKNLFLDDEGTFLHSPAPNPDGCLLCTPKKGAEFGPRWREQRKNCAKPLTKNGTESASS
jgi:hypothetical protein